MTKMYYYYHNHIPTDYFYSKSSNPSLLFLVIRKIISVIPLTVFVLYSVCLLQIHFIIITVAKNYDSLVSGENVYDYYLFRSQKYANRRHSAVITQEHFYQNYDSANIRLSWKLLFKASLP